MDRARDASPGCDSYHRQTKQIGKDGKSRKQMRRLIILHLLVTAVVLISSAAAFVVCSTSDSEPRDKEMSTLGGIHDSPQGAENSVEIESLARFAVDEHNKKENSLLELARVVKAKEQVVSGTLHHLTLEVVDAGKKKLYEAKVWVKPWLNFKELQEFKHAGDASFTSCDLGAHQGEPQIGWKQVPAHDPEVQIAADHAVKAIQQRSNSLAPYVLQEILLAKAEVNEGLAKFDLILNVKRGNTEEKYKVLVHKNDEGSFHLNHMEPHQG